MIKHIVMWELKEKNKAENAKKIKIMLNDLKNKIDEIVSIESGININSGDAAFDIALFSEFKNEKDLAAYQIHEEHQKVVKFVRSVTTNRAVVDYKC